MGLLVAAVLAPTQVWAAANLVLTPSTWNVIGLDSNNPTTGPNHFPVGARLCNTGDATATGIVATFNWDSTDPYINLRPFTSNSLSVASLPPATCTELTFEVEVTRSPSAYGRRARYYIAVDVASPGIALSTPRPRELFIERLVSQARNSVLDVLVGDSLTSLTSIPNGGATTFLVGNTYYVRVVAATATQGYEQLESFITLPNTIFRVLSVSSTYSADTSPTVANPSPYAYADGCSWENDPNSPNYRSCNASGKAGGNIVATYHIQILGAGSANPEKLSSLVHDFSGSSFHYNGDYDVSTRYAYVLTPGAVTVAKSFVPSTIVPGGTSTMVLRITNPGTSPLAGVSIEETLPTSPGAMAIAATPNASTVGCGAPTFAPVGGAGSFAFGDGTIAPNGTCIIKVNVTSPVAGSYTSTTGNLFINGTTDTGNTASATLTAATNAVACTNGTMANWTIPNGTTANPPDTAGGLPTTKAGNVASAALAARFPASTSLLTSAGQNDTTSWRTYGYGSSGNYVDATIDTRNHANVMFSFYAANPSPSNGPTQLVVAANSGSGFSNVATFTTLPIAYTLFSVNLTGLTSTSGTTTVRLTATGAKNDNSGASLDYDNVLFTGCSYVPPPTLSKAFGAGQIDRGSATSLTFSLANTATTPYGAVALTGVSFSDVMPTGLVVATPSGASTTCPSGSVSALAGSSTIALSGAGMAAGSTCTVSVNVTGTAAGVFDNVSGYIASTESGSNNGSSGFGSASITVVAPPDVAAAVSATPIFVTETTTLSLTLYNPNPTTPLSAVALSAALTLPGGVTVATTSSSACGGTLSTTGPATVDFAGGTLAALESCALEVELTGTVAGDKVVSVPAVTASTGGTGSGTSVGFVVEDRTPGIALLEQIGTSPTGPWSSFVAVSEGDAVYYRFVVENVGDAALTSVSVTDDTLALPCVWPDLPVADADDDDHIATCVVGPITATTGSLTTTSTATAYFSSTAYEDSASASYATAEVGLTLGALESDMGGEGELIHYTYAVSNAGFASLADPVTVSDDLTSVSCPPLDTVGDNDAFLDPGEILVCTSTYTITATDVSNGYVTNHALASVAGFDSNDDTVTLYAVFCSQPSDPDDGAYASCDPTPSGGTCTLSCAAGHTASGDATCNAGVWTSETCDPNPCTSQPVAPSNGALDDCNPTPSGGTCALTCDPGYTASGDATCAAGAWSTETCNPNPCAAQPADPSNGTYASCNPTASGGTCALTCDADYTASGDATCTLGAWSAETCNPNPCAAQPADPTHGTYTSCNPSASGGTCALTCDPGYTASGDATCTLGAWSAETCNPNPCAAQPADPINGTYASCNPTASGGACALTCAPGYTASGDATCTLGAWSEQTCEPNPCTAQPTNPAHGSYASCNPTTSGGTCALTCDAGYMPSGDAQCTAGAWSNPSCQPGCASDAHCASPTPVCDMPTSTCVECLTTADCAAGLCDTVHNVCVDGCLGDGDCAAPTPRCRTSDNVCVQCSSTSDCDAGVCNPTSQQCVACLGDGDCPFANVCDISTHTCAPTGCAGGAPCASPTPACDTANNVCVACMVDNNCLGTTPACDVSTHTCVECQSDDDCAEPNPACDVATQRCVECLDDSDCDAGACHPTANVCVECTSGTHCPSNACNLSTFECAEPPPPDDPDTDGDGRPNSEDDDDDDDGLPDEDELRIGTDPLNPDTDGGSLGDGAEVELGLDPLDPSDDVVSLGGGRLFGCAASQPTQWLAYLAAALLGRRLRKGRGSRHG